MRTILPDDRGRRGLSYTLLTPANRFSSRLATLPGAQYFKLVTPRLAPARFSQALVVAGGQPIACPLAPGRERFLLGIGGEAWVRTDEERFALDGGGFAYLGQSQYSTLELTPGASVMVIGRAYEPWPGLAEPAPVFGRLREVGATPTPTPGLGRRELLDPTDPAFDFNISHMEFEPGVELPQIEVHDEEHGLYMTAGGGLYHLDGDELEVMAEDFIYMAPYCPQGFRAGPEGGSYLLYKDVYRERP